MQITFVGIILIAIFYAIGAAVLLPIWRRLRDSKKKWTVLAPITAGVILLPIADELWISSNFHRLCKGAGVQVIKKVEVNGFLNTDRSPAGIAEPRIVRNPEIIKEFDDEGYQFRENLLSDGRAWRLERVKEGLQASILDRPTARYHYKRIVDFEDARGVHHEKPVSYKIEISGEEVVDSQTGETIGRYVRYSRYPGWVESLWVRFFGTGRTTCKGSAPPELGRLLYHYVLIPKNKS